MPSPQPARCRRCKASEGALQRPRCSLICQDPTHDCESPTLCWPLTSFLLGVRDCQISRGPPASQSTIRKIIAT